jgi:hypothetical protein
MSVNIFMISVRVIYFSWLIVPCIA